MTSTFRALDREKTDRLPANEWRQRGRRVAVAAIGVGLAFDFTVHRAIDGRSGTMLSIAATIALCVGGRVRRADALAIAALAPVFGIWLSVRESPWLLVLDLVAISGLLVIAAGFSTGGDPLDLTFVDGARRGLAAAGAVVRGPIHLCAAVAALISVSVDGDRRTRWAPVARGVGLALPLALATGILLASADGVFASLFHLPVDTDRTLTHAVATLAGAMAALVLIAHAYAPSPVARIDPRRSRVGTFELAIVLGVLVGLYATFAVAQAVALTRGAEYVRRTTGLTYAEYARRGYFQLLIVAALTALVLIAVRPTMRAASAVGRRTLVVFGEAAVALTLVIIASAIHRLNVYDDAFGLTMLRLSCIVFAYWLGAVFVLVAISYLSRGARNWLAPAIAGSALLTLFVWNAVNPEAIVARHNVANAQVTIRFDPDYLASLSDDAVPTLVANMSRLSAGDRVALTRALCRQHDQADRGFWSANHSASAARRALEKVC